MFLVYGSGKSSGMAAIAKKHFGANNAPGLAESGYAISVKSSGILHSIEQIEQEVQAFKSHAESHSNDQFYVTQLGCEEGEYRHDQIAPLFESAPGNVILPGAWINIVNNKLKKPAISRLIITGPRTFKDYELLNAKVGNYISKLNPDSIEIVSGGDAGTDAMGEQFAIERNIKIVKPHIEIERFAGHGGYELCNKLWAMYATHAIVFNDGNSKVVSNFIEATNLFGIRTVVVRI